MIVGQVRLVPSAAFIDVFSMSHLTPGSNFPKVGREETIKPRAVSSAPACRIGIIQNLNAW